MFGKTLVTQTGSDGKEVKRLYIEASNILKNFTYHA